ncbi:protein LOL2-like [Miscanthus floridulus]|uniref:protein LOL2-like n=1 Tax=Miscanthus floridulus TaxID=154761 RepID=UPI00345898D8
MQSQIVCHGCRTVLLYPRGAPSVCCAVCHAVTNVPPPAMEMARLICGGCQTLLMYTRSATTVRCSCCNTVNLVRPVSSIAHVNCGQCQTVLMYPYGAPSVKCAICNFITNVGGVTPVRPLPPALPASSGNSYSIPSTSAVCLFYELSQNSCKFNVISHKILFVQLGQPTNQSQNVTVVVENPMTVDDKGKLVSNVVVGVTSGGKK